MRIVVPSVAAIAFLGAVSAAYAAPPADILNATGTITSFDASKHMVTLDNGSAYVASPSVKFSAFKVGEKVKAAYFKSGDDLDMLWMKSVG